MKRSSDKSEFMEIKWEDGFRIKVGVDDENTVLISANQEGLLSLAALWQMKMLEAIFITMRIIHSKKAPRI